MRVADGVITMVKPSFLRLGSKRNQKAPYELVKYYTQPMIAPALIYKIITPLETSSISQYVTAPKGEKVTA